MLFSMRRRLGRPLGFPEVPLTKRVAIPASCTLSSLPTGDFDSESRSIRYSSNESVMEAPKVVLVELRNISISPIDRSFKCASIIMIGAGSDVAGPHMPNAFWHGRTTLERAAKQQRFLAEPRTLHQKSHPSEREPRSCRCTVPSVGSRHRRTS